jgi:hypothetical protein
LNKFLKLVPALEFAIISGVSCGCVRCSWGILVTAPSKGMGVMISQKRGVRTAERFVYRVVAKHNFSATCRSGPFVHNEWS